MGNEELRAPCFFVLYTLSVHVDQKRLQNENQRNFFERPAVLETR